MYEVAARYELRGKPMHCTLVLSLGSYKMHLTPKFAQECADAVGRFQSSYWPVLKPFTDPIAVSVMSSTKELTWEEGLAAIDQVSSRMAVGHSSPTDYLFREYGKLSATVQFACRLKRWPDVLNSAGRSLSLIDSILSVSDGASSCYWLHKLNLYLGGMWFPTLLRYSESGMQGTVDMHSFLRPFGTDKTALSHIPLEYLRASKWEIFSLTESSAILISGSDKVDRVWMRWYKLLSGLICLRSAIANGIFEEDVVLQAEALDANLVRIAIGFLLMEMPEVERIVSDCQSDLVPSEFGVSRTGRRSYLSLREFGELCSLLPSTVDAFLDAVSRKEGDQAVNGLSRIYAIAKDLATIGSVPL
jgi:hypothetical protein